jgi:thiamine-phosphate pyrophosphorylase
MSQLSDNKLYLITDRKLFSTEEAFFGAIEEALGAGVKIIQLREKDLETRDLLRMAYRCRGITRRFSASLFINDRLDIALIVEADGLHLGNSGLPVSVARKIVKNRLMLGCSTHSLQEAKEAEAGGADFITYGPLFVTPSKMQYGEPVGLMSLYEVSKRVSLPIFGLGGVKIINIHDVMNSGASGIALISGILGASDVGAAAAAYLKKSGERI